MVLVCCINVSSAFEVSFGQHVSGIMPTHQAMVDDRCLCPTMLSGLQLRYYVYDVVVGYCTRLFEEEMLLSRQVGLAMVWCRIDPVQGMVGSLKSVRMRTVLVGCSRATVIHKLVWEGPGLGC